MGATASWNLYEAIQRCSEVIACEAFVAHRALQAKELQSSTCVTAFVRCMNSIVNPEICDRSTSRELINISRELTSSKWLSVIQSTLAHPLKKSL